jgi:hypothetical protein
MPVKTKKQKNMYMSFVLGFLGAQLLGVKVTEKVDFDVGDLVHPVFALDGTVAHLFTFSLN